MNSFDLNRMTVLPVRAALHQWRDGQTLRALRGVPALSVSDQLSLTVTCEAAQGEQMTPPASDEQDVATLQELAEHAPLLAQWVALQLGHWSAGQLSAAQATLQATPVRHEHQGGFEGDVEHPAYAGRLLALQQRLIALTLCRLDPARAAELAAWSRQNGYLADWTITLQRLGYSPDLISVLHGHRRAAELSRAMSAREERTPPFDALIRLNELQFQLQGLSLRQSDDVADTLPRPDSALNPTPVPADTPRQPGPLIAALLRHGQDASVPPGLPSVRFDVSARLVNRALRAQLLPFPEVAVWNELTPVARAELQQMLFLLALTRGATSLGNWNRPSEALRVPKWFRASDDTLLNFSVALRDTGGLTKLRRQMLKDAARLALKHSDPDAPEREVLRAALNPSTRKT